MLIQTDVGRAEVVAKQLAELAGVLSAEYVTGPYDVVVAHRRRHHGRPAGQRRAERSAGRRHHPHADLPDRQRSTTLELLCGTHDRRPAADGPPRSLLIAAIAVAAVAIIAVLVIAAVRQLPEQLQPVPIAVGARTASATAPNALR